MRALNQWKERSVDPRRDFRRKHRGALSPGELRVFDGLDRIGHHHRDSEGRLREDIEVDSILESAFCSTEQRKWGNYKASFRAPRASEISQEDVVLCNADALDDQSPRDPDGPPQFSGSELSSDPALDPYDSDSDINIIESESLQDIFDEAKAVKASEFYKNRDAQNKQNTKYCHFKVVNGLKLPLPQGVHGRKFSVNEMIDISGYLLRVGSRAVKTKRTTSLCTIQRIIESYQEALVAAPLDLMRGLSVSGFLILNDYALSAAQISALACSLPFITRLRSIDLRNINMKDTGAAEILRAANLLQRIQSIKIDRNEVGPKMAA